MNNSLESAEQLYELESFIRKYWKIIAAAIILILVLLVCFGFYKSHQNSQHNAELNAYYPTLSKVNANNIKEALTFTEDNHSIYSVFVDIAIAKYYAEDTKQYDLALQHLLLAKKNIKEEILLSIVNLRIARLQIQLEKYQDSINTLNTITDGALFSLASNLKGDVYYTMKKYALAKMAYEQAMIAQNKDLPKQEIRMKINQVDILLARENPNSAN